LVKYCTRAKERFELGRERAWTEEAMDIAIRKQRRDKFRVRLNRAMVLEDTEGNRRKGEDG